VFWGMISDHRLVLMRYGKTDARQFFKGGQFMGNDFRQEIEKIMRLIIDEVSMMATVSTKHIILYQSAPARFDFTEAEINNIQPTIEMLSATTREKLLTIAHEIATMKYDTDKQIRDVYMEEQIAQCLIRSSRYAHKEAQLLAVFAQGQSRINDVIFNEASKIMQWTKIRKSIHQVKLYIVPAINTEIDFKISEYQLQRENWIEKSKTAYYSGSSGQEALERAMNTSVITFKEDLTSTNLDNFTEEINIFLIALSFGLKGIYAIDDISIKSQPWELSPDLKPIFHREAWPKYHSNHSFVRTLEWHSTYLKDNIDLFYEITNADVQSVNNWYSLLENNRKSIFSFTQVLNGFKEVTEANAFNYIYLNKHNKSLNGIYLMLSGLEGLNSECKPRRKNGTKYDAKSTFADCWSNLLSRQIAKQMTNSPLKKITQPSELFKTIYSLRSDIAHSDPNDIQTNCMKTKELLGDYFNPGDYSAATIGICLMKTISDLMIEFLQDKNLLSELLIGNLPRNGTG